MTRLLRKLLKEDYLAVVKEAMLRNHWNNTTLARQTGYSKAHIGNLLAGNGSDDALWSACKALDIDIRNLMKGFNIDNDSTARPDDSYLLGKELVVVHTASGAGTGSSS